MVPPQEPSQAPFRLLVIKTGALGDVLRTTSILSGLEARHGAGLRITWITAHGARPLLEGLATAGRITALHTVAPKAVEPDELGDLGRFDQILSLDDEAPLCAFATRAACPDGFDAAAIERLVIGAYLDADGERKYTRAAGPWFDMGLLSVHGKAAADRMKVENERSHPAIFADMLGIAPGEPELLLDAPQLSAAEARLARAGSGLRIGLNTGSGGRWASKALPEERVVSLAAAIAEDVRARVGAEPVFILLGGPEERERNARLATALAERVRIFDTGCDNGLVEFAALVDGLDLLVTSDSLALHMANARRVPIVAFFAPTSAAEIELYGRGAKVQSTTPDYCSYQKDADTSTLTVERLLAAFREALPQGRMQDSPRNPQ